MDKNVPPSAAKLLDFIGSIEAPRGYGTIYGNNQGKLPKPLTAMTLDEVIAAGPAWTRRFGSSACGRYQFMKATLVDLKAELGLRGTQVFDANLQDRLGYHLLKRRGYDTFIAGTLPAEAFMLNLAKEWASFPVPSAVQGGTSRVTRGQSFYAGDGLNACLVKPEQVAAVVAAAFELRNAPRSRTAGTAVPQVKTPGGGGCLAGPPDPTQRRTTMIPAAIPILIFDVISQAVQKAAERVEVDIPEDRKDVIAAQVVREAQKLPEMQDLKEAAAPKSRWHSRGMIGALVAGLAGIAGAFGFALAPEEIDAVIGLISNGIVVVGAVMAWVGRKNATRSIA